MLSRILVSTLVLLSLGLPAAAQPPNPQIAGAFEEQIAFVTALAPDELPRGLRQGLLSKLRFAHNRYLRGQPPVESGQPPTCVCRPRHGSLLPGDAAA